MEGSGADFRVSFPSAPAELLSVFGERKNKGLCFSGRSTQNSSVPPVASILERPFRRFHSCTFFSSFFLQRVLRQCRTSQMHIGSGILSGFEPCPMVILRFRDAEKKGIDFFKWLHKSCPCMLSSFGKMTKITRAASEVPHIPSS